MKSKFLILLTLIFGLSATPSQAMSPPPLRPVVGYALQADLSPPLREMPMIPPMEIKPVSPVNRALPKALRSPLAQVEPWADSALQTTLGYDATMPAPIQSFDGVSNLDSVMPPDSQGDIGYDPDTGTKYYVQWVNLHFAIWDVTNTPTQIYGPASGNTLWQGFGGPCETRNDGDPITLYDPLAHRWLMSQFAVGGPYYQCIAISQTPDPTGAWYRYAFKISDTKMNDYPKFGVWPDGYYMSINQFTSDNAWAGAGVIVFERDKLLSGEATASFQYFDLQSVNNNYGGMLPSDLDGNTLPPTGAPNYFVEVDDSSWIGTVDAMRIWKFHVDWKAPSQTTFGINGNPNATLQVTSWTPACSSCIPQPDTQTQLDALSDRLMYRLAYRNFGDHESLVVNHTVDAGGRTGIRWYEVRDPNSTPTLYQQGTYAPDSDYRWMGSIAMDTSGNIALGFSVSSSNLYPSVRYAGRLESDPLGTLPQKETSLVSGRGSQTSSYGRWGDYSMLSIDPEDDCTFWYTQEYMDSTSSGAWHTRIGSFRFPTCGASAKGTIQGTVHDATSEAPLSSATVSIQEQASGNWITVQTDYDGHYAHTLHPGTYTVTAQSYGYLPQTISGLEIVQGLTVTQDFTLTLAPTHPISGTVRDARTGWPLYAHLHVTGDPISPPAPHNTTWSDPVTGFYSFTLPGSITYTVQATPWLEGYQSSQATLPLLTHPISHTFALKVDSNHTPPAPGYEPSNQGTLEDFHAASPEGWTVIDYAGNGVQWRFDDPCDRGNKTGGDGAFAMIDSDYGGDEDVDTELRSPIFDFSTSSTIISDILSYSAIIIEFKTDFRWWEFNQNEIADVDVSTDGGNTWINVWRQAGSSLRGPKTIRVDITSQAAGQAAVQVRFHYYNAHYEWWWQIDDVFIGLITLTPQAGGLIVGNVYDANTQHPLSNAHIVGEAPRNPALPPVNEGFYTRFALQGPQLITATAPSYGTITTTVAVPLSDTVRQDLALPMGLVVTSPPTVHVSMANNTILTRTLYLSNLGGLPATYTIQMKNIEEPFSPARITGKRQQSHSWLTVHPLTGTILANTTQPVLLTFTPQNLAHGQEYTAYLHVDTNTPYSSSVVPITLTERTTYNFTITPQNSTQAGRPGDPVTHAITLTNTGDTTDTFNISVTDAAWTLSGPAAVGPLAAQQSERLNFTITIPTTATPDDTNEATFTLISQGDPNITRTVHLITTIKEEIPVHGVSFTYRPRYPRGGESITFTGTVTTGTPPLAYAWSFGDGTPLVTGQVVSHTYDPQTGTLMHSYIVSLTVSNRWGSDCTHQQIILNQERFYIYIPLVLRQ